VAFVIKSRDHSRRFLLCICHGSFTGLSGIASPLQPILHDAIIKCIQRKINVLNLIKNVNTYVVSVSSVEGCSIFWYSPRREVRACIARHPVAVHHFAATRGFVG